VAGDPQDEPPNLLQQPLAMAYYLSTAKTGPLPKWFWSAAPENECRSPNCFKVFARAFENGFRLHESSFVCC